MVKFRIFIPESWDFIHQIVYDFKAIFLHCIGIDSLMICCAVIFCMLRCNLRTPLPIHFKLRIVIGIDSPLANSLQTSHSYWN